MDPYTIDNVPLVTVNDITVVMDFPSMQPAFDVPGYPITRTRKTYQAFHNGEFTGLVQIHPDGLGWIAEAHDPWRDIDNSRLGDLDPGSHPHTFKDTAVQAMVTAINLARCYTVTKKTDPFEAFQTDETS